MFGDIPPSDVQQACTMFYMTEYYQHATPFLYDQKSDKVVYNSNFNHIDSALFDPANSERVD